jgi:putative thioredoxin
MMPPNVLNAHEQSFQHTVIERSREVPVLVDFWAPWCGPCRVLSPLLEELAGAGNGTWFLVKVNTDENQGLARRYNVQGIPFCVLFKDGAVVDSFVGVQGKPAIQRFLQKWIAPPANDALSGIEAQIRQGAFQAAHQTLDEVLAQSPDDERARVAYARLELAQGKPKEALDHLEQLSVTGNFVREKWAFTAQAHFLQNLPHPFPPVDELEAVVDANPNDIEARFRLGSAAALLDARAIAAEQFLWILQRNRSWNDDAARNALLDLFALWGEDAPETAHYRQKMGWVLFS